MTIEKIEELLRRGEGIEIEFKTAQFELNKDIFATTPGAVPELIEGDVFKSVIPIGRFEVSVSRSANGWLEVRNKVRNKFGIRFAFRVEKIFST
jgi:hypothetical protein